MSTIKLKGSSSGEAEVTVAAAAGTPTFTLPTTVGSSNQLLKNSGTAGTLQYSSTVEDSSGRVLVGTATSKSSGAGQYAKLNVQGGVGTTENFVAFSRNEGAATMSAGDEVSNLTFTDSVGYEFARIQVVADAATGATDTPGRIGFRTTADGSSSSTERMLIQSDGHVKINDGNLVIGTSGHGIDFSANSHASGMTSETLDDYEEGTWDPDFFYHSSVSGVSGHYTKIGRMVYAYFTGTFYSNSSSQQYISNLPFTVANISGSAGGVARGYQNYDIQNGPIYWLQQNTTKMYFYKDNGVNFTGADGNGKNFRGMIVYTAA